MQNLPKFRNLIVCLIVVSLLPGCQSLNTSMHDIGDYSRGSILQNISVGDQVRINAADGETYHLEITSLGENTLAGEDVEINYSDIERLEVQRSVNVRSGDSNIVLITILGALVVAVLITVSNHDSSGCSLEEGVLCGLQK